MAAVSRGRARGWAEPITGLGEVWARRRVREPIEATLLDATAVYAACDAASHVSSGQIETIQLYLREGSRRVRVKTRSLTLPREAASQPRHATQANDFESRPIRADDRWRRSRGSTRFERR